MLPSISTSYGQRRPLDFLLVAQVCSADGADQQTELGILKKSPWEVLLLSPMLLGAGAEVGTQRGSCPASTYGSQAAWYHPVLHANP